MYALTSTHTVNVPVYSAEEGLGREMDLLDAVASGKRQAGFMLWRCQRSLVVPRNLANRPRFASACDRMNERGWPVVVRQTGGDLTPQSPGLLNVAMVFRQQRHTGAIHDSYQQLCAPLIRALDTLGIQAYCNSVQGAFCDGDYNLVVDGKKLAGTAQRWRHLRNEVPSRTSDHAVLAQAVILVDEKLTRLWHIGNEFYRACDIDYRIEPQRHIALSELLHNSHGALIEQVSDCIQDTLQEWLLNQLIPTDSASPTVLPTAPQ